MRVRNKDSSISKKKGCEKDEIQQKSPKLLTLETVEQKTKTDMLKKYSKLENYHIAMTTEFSTQAVYVILQKNGGIK